MEMHAMVLVVSLIAVCFELTPHSAARPLQYFVKRCLI